MYVLLALQEAADEFGMGAIKWYLGKGLCREATGVQDLSAELGASASHLQATCEQYNLCANKGVADSYGKSVFPVAVDPDGVLYAFQVTPAMHYCMGGVRIDTGAGVAAPDGSRLPGLFAAGEVTGGLHGKNRLAGNSLLDCVVFGRRAAASACAHVSRTL